MVPAGLTAAAELDPVTDDPALTPEQLDEVDGVLTTCACAIAATGTIVLDHRDGQGRRALTLVPDYHLVIVHAEQIVAAVPDAVAVLDPPPAADVDQRAERHQRHRTPARRRRARPAQP